MRKIDATPVLIFACSVMPSPMPEAFHCSYCSSSSASSYALKSSRATANISFSSSVA
jgi:transcription elongation factor Elf1